MGSPCSLGYPTFIFHHRYHHWDEKSGVPASVEPDLPLPAQHALLQLPHKVLTLSFWTPYQSPFMQPIPWIFMTIPNP